MRKGIRYPFARFYIKKIGGTFFIEHRLTHSHVTAVESEEELVSCITKLNALGQYDLYNFLFENGARIPEQKNTLSKEYSGYNEAEDWFISAWSYYTDSFYLCHPELLLVEEEIPYDIVNQIRVEKYNKIKEQRLREDADREKKVFEKELTVVEPE